MGIGNVAKEVHSVMSAVKVSNKNSAVLRKETKLRPLLENKTKWTGRCKMMKNFVSKREALMKSSNIKMRTSISVTQLAQIRCCMTFFSLLRLCKKMNQALGLPRSS